MTDWLFIIGLEVSILCSDAKLVHGSRVQRDLSVYGILQFLMLYIGFKSYPK